MTRCCPPRRRHNHPVDIPDAVLGDVITLPRTEAAANPGQCIRTAMARPIGTVGLDRTVRPSDRVAIIVDDMTRETPAALILPPVLEVLADSGVAPDRIAIVIALGTHRPMTPAEIDGKVGAAVARKYRIVNTPAWQQEDMVYLGQSAMGIPAWVNRAAAHADVRIGIGMIAPHLDAGYGGGAKIILPGVCGQATVDAFHAQMASIHANQLGIPDALLRLDLERFVEEYVPLHFIVNAVLDSRGSLYRCVAGDAVAAHRAGVCFARDVYGAPVKRRYPLVIADAYPHGIDLWQSTKALAAGELLTCPGGDLILVADCPEGVGPHPRFADYIGMALDELRRRFLQNTLEDSCAAAEAMAVCRMKQRIRIGMVTGNLSTSVLRRMGFEAYPTVGSAIERAGGSIAKNDIALLTHGGVILPLLPPHLAVRPD